MLFYKCATLSMHVSPSIHSGVDPSNAADFINMAAELLEDAERLISQNLNEIEAAEARDSVSWLMQVLNERCAQAWSENRTS